MRVDDKAAFERAAKRWSETWREGTREYRLLDGAVGLHGLAGASGSAKTPTVFAHNHAHRGSAVWVYGPATLSDLSLEGNDLTRGGKLEKPFDGLCAALGKAKALTQLNLWRCGLSEAAGRTLAEGLRSNDLLILVETGGNDVLAEDQRDVDDTLRRNRDALDDRSTTAKAEARRRRTEAKERAVEEARREKAAEVDAWIEQRRGERTAAREKAALEAKKDEEEAAQRREAKERTRREMLEKQKSEGKKGGGKKKKK